MDNVKSLTFREKIASVSLRALPIRNGRHRLLSRLIPLLGSPPQGIRELPWGSTRLATDGADFVGRQFLILHTFDPEVVEVLASLVDDGAELVVWDIGANMGTFSYQFLARFPEARIVAVEPQQELADLVGANLKLIHPGLYEVFPVAIGEDERDLRLEVPVGMKGSATFLPKFLPPGLNTDSVIVQTVPAQWIHDRSGFGWPTIAKLDIQGFESKAIKSLRPALSDGALRALVFEHMGDFDDDWRDITRELTRANYLVFAILRTAFRTWLERVDAPTKKATDYVAIREDLAASRGDTLIYIKKFPDTASCFRKLRG